MDWVQIAAMVFVGFAVLWLVVVIVMLPFALRHYRKLARAEKEFWAKRAETREEIRRGARRTGGIGL